MIENVKCPDCCGPMTSRKNNSTGQRFWGCNRYPTCKGTRNTDGDVPSGRHGQSGLGDLTDELPSDRLRKNDRGRWGHQ